MELQPTTAARYLHRAFDTIDEIVGRTSDHLTDRPDGDDRSIGVLAIQCCDLVEYWIGHVALGRPSPPKRNADDDDFLDLAQVHRAMETARARIDADVEAMYRGPERRRSPIRQFLPTGDESNASVFLHTLEELHRHIGQMEVVAGAVTRQDGSG